MNLRALAKVTLLKLGAASSEKTIHYLNGLFDYIELGWWLRERGFTRGIRLSSCFEVFGAIATEVGDRPVLYLQFGVEDAAIVSRWASLLCHPETKLHVFDPADGRFDTWLPARGRGHLWESRDSITGGGAAVRRLVQKDQRIRHFEGDFQNLLHGYEWANAEVVVAVFDTDVYSATKIALDFVGHRLLVGSYLFFDQLNHRADELRAFHEFLLDSGMAFELFAGNRELSCVAFRRQA